MLTALADTLLPWTLCESVTVEFVFWGVVFVLVPFDSCSLSFWPGRILESQCKLFSFKTSTVFKLYFSAISLTVSPSWTTYTLGISGTFNFWLALSWELVSRLLFLANSLTVILCSFATDFSVSPSFTVTVAAWATALPKLLVAEPPASKATANFKFLVAAANLFWELILTHPFYLTKRTNRFS